MLLSHNNNTQVKAGVHFKYLVMVFITVQLICMHAYEHIWCFDPSIHLRRCLMAKE